MEKQGDADFAAIGYGKDHLGLLLFKKPFGEQRFVGNNLILHMLVFGQQVNKT